MAHLRVAFDGEQAVAILARAGREGAGPVVHAVEGVAGARAASDALHEPAPPAGRREEHVLPLQEKACALVATVASRHIPAVPNLV